MEVTLLEKGKRYITRQAYEKAIQVFLELIRRFPASKEAYFEIGKAYVITGRIPLALENLQKAIDRNAAHADAHMLLAKAYKIDGNEQEARRYFEKAKILGYCALDVDKELALLRIKAKTPAGEASRNSMPQQVSVPQVLERIKALNAEERIQEALALAAECAGVMGAASVLQRNILDNERELAERKIYLTSKVRQLTVVLNSECNLRCIMCPTRENNWILPEKTKDEIRQLFPFLEKITWLGGEVFLYKHFNELLDGASKFPLKQNILTNGLLITEESAERLVRYGCDIDMSIDGPSKDLYEAIRVGGDFDSLVANIAMINRYKKKYASPMRLNMYAVIMRSNYTRLREFVAFAAAHEFHTLVFRMHYCDTVSANEDIFYKGNNSEVLEYFEGMFPEVEDLCKKHAIELISWLPKTENTLSRFDVPDLHSSQEKGAAHAGSVQSLPCHVPWKSLMIDSGGIVRPGPYCSDKHILGNVKDTALAELWNNGPMQEYRKKLIAHTNHDLCAADCLSRKVPQHFLKYL